jgi:hypothetical protein
MKRNSRKSPLNRVLAVVEAIPVAKFVRSQRGVPMAVVGDKSICWFGTDQHYRVFHGYGHTGDQRRFDYPDVAGVVSHFESLQKDAVLEWQAASLEGLQAVPSADDATTDPGPGGP